MFPPWAARIPRKEQAYVSYAFFTLTAMVANRSGIPSHFYTLQAISECPLLVVTHKIDM